MLRKKITVTCLPISLFPSCMSCCLCLLFLYLYIFYPFVSYFMCPLFLLYSFLPSLFLDHFFLHSIFFMFYFVLFSLSFSSFLRSSLSCMFTGGLVCSSRHNNIHMYNLGWSIRFKLYLVAMSMQQNRNSFMQIWRPSCARCVVRNLLELCLHSCHTVW